MPGPMTGVRVVEVGDLGEVAGKLLADAGAEVIRVEPPAGARSRHTGPFVDDRADPNASLHFAYLNTNKRGVTLDLAADGAAAAWRALIETADVVIDAAGPGVLEGLGVGRDACQDLERLVWCSITPFGLTGPWRDRPTNDLVSMALGGIVMMCGYDDHELPPVRPDGEHSLAMGGEYASMGIIAALLERERTGHGALLDVSIHECVAGTTEGAFWNWEYNGVNPEGVRVLDFTWVRAGPWATRWLAVMGAEVIKVEWPDPRLAFTGRTGSLGDASAGPNSNGHFNDQNAQKLSITVNVRSPKGLRIIKDLLSSTDIVIENFSAGVLRDWGLSFDEMQSIKPDLIYVSMAGFGQTGPHAHYTTFGPSAQALSGLTFLSGLPDAPPAGWGWSYMDDTGGMHGAISALTALHHKQLTGEGQHVDLSQVATGMTLTGPALLDLSANGRGSRRPGYPPGNRTHWPDTELLNNYRGRQAAPHNAYRTIGDGHNDCAAIACFSDGEWRNLVGAMGDPD